MSASDLDLTGHPNGFCIRHRGVVVDIFPSFLGAAAGLKAARQALTELNRTLTEGINHDQ